MDLELGRVELIYWQNRNRRTRSGLSLWTAASLVGLPTGAILATAQAVGWLHWAGPFAAAPAALVLLALAGPLVAVTRAVLGWVGG
jgi:hypothetical protein